MSRRPRIFTFQEASGPKLITLEPPSESATQQDSMALDQQGSMSSYANSRGTGRTAEMSSPFQWRDFSGYRTSEESPSDRMEQRSDLRASFVHYEHHPVGLPPSTLATDHSTNAVSHQRSPSDADQERHRARAKEIIQRRRGTKMFRNLSQAVKVADPRSDNITTEASQKPTFRHSVSGSIRSFSSGAIKTLIGKRKRSSQEEEPVEEPPQKRTATTPRVTNAPKPDSPVLTGEPAVQRLKVERAASGLVHPSYRIKTLNADTLAALEGEGNDLPPPDSGDLPAYLSFRAQGRNSSLALALAVDGCEAERLRGRSRFRAGEGESESDAQANDWTQGQREQIRSYMRWADSAEQ